MESKAGGGAAEEIREQTGEEPREEAAAPAGQEESAQPAPQEPEAPDGKADKKPEKAEKTEKSRKKEKSETIALKAEVEKLQKELAECRDQYQRMLAEYANYKRRTEQEKERLGEFTKGEILKSMLNSLDNMERAIDAPAGDDYKTGVDMVLRQFRETLLGMGLEEIEAQDAPFNPEIHHAVMREDADGVEPDTVTEVFQKGYKMGGRVLRPAMVKVAN